jgi:hypothetical protein
MWKWGAGAAGAPQDILMSWSPGGDFTGGDARGALGNRGLGNRAGMS